MGIRDLKDQLNELEKKSASWSYIHSLRLGDVVNQVYKLQQYYLNHQRLNTGELQLWFRITTQSDIDLDQVDIIGRHIESSYINDAEYKGIVYQAVYMNGKKTTKLLRLPKVHEDNLGAIVINVRFADPLW